MKKVIGQTVRDLKREVNKKVLKVPGIEQKVLDATSNEPWGPHGSLLADISQATRNPHEYQMIMAVIWKRINDTGKNWRHVYKALTVLDYLVAHGSERVIDEIREHAYQISTLSNFQYIDSSGRDQGNNVRKKSQSLVVLVNDKERIMEVRQKAAANRDKFRNNAAGGMYRPGSYSSSGGYGDRYDDDRYGSREEDRNGYGYGREREYGDDRNTRDGDRYGRDYEERYGRDIYRDDDYRERSRSVDYQYDTRSRSSDRDRYDDDGQHSSRGSNAKAEDQSLEARLERKISEQNAGAPPSYEEAVRESRSPVHSEKDVETSSASAPRDSSPCVNDNTSQTSAPTGSSPLNDNPSKATTATSTAASGAQETQATDDIFDPRGPASAAPAAPAATAAPAAPAATNNIEMDLFGSLSDSFSSNALSLVQAEPATAAPDANAGSTASFAAPSSGSNNFNQSFEDPFGDSPFKAFTSTETTPSQTSQSNGLNTETNSDFGFGDSFSVVPYSAPVASDTQPFSTNSQFSPQDLSSSQQETDILADILPPAPLPEMTSQQNVSAPGFAQSSPSFPASSGQMASQPFSEPTGQFTQQGLSATSQPAQTFPVPTDQNSQQPFSAPNGQPGQVQSSFSSPPIQYAQQPFSSPTSQYGQQPFSSHAGQPGMHAFSSSTGQHMQPPFASQGGQHAQSGGMYVGLHSQDGSPTMSTQSQNGYNGHMNSGNFLPQGSTTDFPSYMAPQAPTGQLSQSTNFPSHGGPTGHNTPHMSSHSPTHQASQFNGQSFIGQQGNPAPFSSPITNKSLISTGSNALVAQPSKEKFETKSTVWADTLSRGLVNLNISGPKTNPLADIGVDFEAINRKEKRMEKPTTTAVTSTVTMGKAMGSGSGMGRAGAGALRPTQNPMMGSGMGMGMGMGNGSGVGMGMGGYGGMNPSMGMGMGGMGGMGGGMGMGQGYQMQPPTGLPPGSNMPGNYNNSMMGQGSYGQQPYGSYGQPPYGGYR